MPGLLRFVPIVGAITVLPQTLGMSIVAEGIENELQLRYLSDLHVTTGQGYLLGKPMEPDAIASLAADAQPERMVQTRRRLAPFVARWLPSPAPGGSQLMI